MDEFREEISKALLNIIFVVACIFNSNPTSDVVTFELNQSAAGFRNAWLWRWWCGRGCNHTNMATPVSVVDETEDYSFLPLIHDIIKWYEYLQDIYDVVRSV